MLSEQLRTMNKGQSDWMPPLAYYTAKPETNRELTVIPKGFHVRHCPTKPARFGLRKGPGS